tara:strand:+ start:2395 stop:2781 length:387 start_codon:yes stop_codon:yes gene_type:complete
MKNNEKISLVVLALIVGFVVSSEMRLFKPTNYLECKTNKGTFYLKIIQRTYTAEEYPNSKYKEDEIIKSFNVDFKKNYIMLDDDMQWDPPPGYSKTDSVFPIHRKTLKIYDPIKKINLGQCKSGENKI